MENRQLSIIEREENYLTSFYEQKPVSAELSAMHVFTCEAPTPALTNRKA